jgi:heme A synthase
VLLVLTQITLGGSVVWSGRNEVINTAHVANGALVLVTSLAVTLNTSRLRARVSREIEPGSISPAQQGAVTP